MTKDKFFEIELLDIVEKEKFMKAANTMVKVKGESESITIHQILFELINAFLKKTKLPKYIKLSSEPFIND